MMSKKNIFLLIVLGSMSLNIKAQLVNVNPDPNGDPWIVNDASLPSQEALAKVTPISLSAISLITPLDIAVDNSQLDYFPAIFDQGLSGACVQVAEIGYTFTYEINRSRNTVAGDWENDLTNIYHPFYTYNFLNNGLNVGTDYLSGYNLITDNSCPAYEFYTDPALDDNALKYLYWMTGYDNYYQGMSNKTTQTVSFSWSNTLESLELLKHWIAHHNEGIEEDGGLATIATFMGGYTIGWIPDGSPEAGKHFIASWGNTLPHALTIVGYNDEIHCFDLNEDEEYENIDENGDGIIQLSECEVGAFKVANSWDVIWPTYLDGGFIYIPYKLFEYGLDIEQTAFSCLINENYTPELTLRINVECDD